VTWVKLDDQFRDHPKVAMAGPMAGWLFVCGLCYASEYRTDGFIPTSTALRLADVPTPRKHIDRLVAVGLWAEEEDGYRVRSYLEYQPSAVEVEERREQRAKAGRRGGKRSGETRSKRASKPEANGKRPAKQTGQPNPTPSPYPTTESPGGDSLPAEPSKALALVEPPSPPTAADRAHALTCDFWENSNPRPAVKFIALRKLTERFLGLGWDEPAVARALRDTRAFTSDAIEYTLREKAEQTAHRPRPKSHAQLEQRIAARREAQA
jgi:hypothetical protein